MDLIALRRRMLVGACDNDLTPELVKARARDIHVFRSLQRQFWSFAGTA